MKAIFDALIVTELFSQLSLSSLFVIFRSGKMTKSKLKSYYINFYYVLPE